MQTRGEMLKNRNGKRIQATVRLADGTPKGTMVLLHGLGGWKEQSVLVAVADRVCAAGYTVLAFDGADGANGPDADFFNNTNTGYLEDLEDVFVWMKEQEWFTSPIILAGHSQGGLVALRFARLHPEGIEKLLLLAPAVAWHSGLWMYWPGALWWLVRGGRKWHGPPGSNLRLSRRWLVDFLGFDGYRDAKHVDVPVLIVSAGRDQTVGKPFIHKRFSQHFKKATWTCVAGAYHSFPHPEDTTKVADTITTWLTSS